MDTEQIQRLMCTKKKKVNNTERYKLSMTKLYRNPTKTTGHRQTVPDVNCIWVYYGTGGTAEKAECLRDRQQQEALIDGRGVREPPPLLVVL